MFWLEDKEKDGEIYTNSECLSYCLKCFKEEKRIEIWKGGRGLKKTYKTAAETIFSYRIIKSIPDEDLEKYILENLEIIG